MSSVGSMLLGKQYANLISSCCKLLVRKLSAIACSIQSEIECREGATVTEEPGSENLAHQIEALEQELLRMGSVVRQMLDSATEALFSRNKVLAERVIALDDTVDAYNLEIENRCLKLLAMHQPVACDLRAIAAIMKIIADVERMGDYIVDIAKTAIRISDRQTPFRLSSIRRMADLAQRMLHEVLQAFVSRDLGLVERMIRDDEEVDSLNAVVHEQLVTLIKKDERLADCALQFLMVARYIERLADHVTNVGERIYYMETGVLKELHISEAARATHVNQEAATEK